MVPRPGRCAPHPGPLAASGASEEENRPTLVSVMPKPLDTRPYRRMIGAIGIGIAVVISAVLFITRGVGTIGIPPGQRLHAFVAPLATSTLSGDANLNPRCDPAHPNPRALNLCPWLARRAPVVLGLFVPASSDCVRQIDAMETMAVNPIQYLVVPRVLASIAMFPTLAMLFSTVGYMGAYLVGVDRDVRVLDEVAYFAAKAAIHTPAS